MLDSEIGKKLGSADHDLQNAVLKSLYHSPAQGRRRRLVWILLILKHSLRGLVFSWPLYFLALAAFFVPGRYSLFLLIFLVPALWVSGTILIRGIREDTETYLKDRVLKPGAIPKILFSRLR